MTEGRERLVRGRVRANDFFLRDLRQLFDAPTELLRIIADRTEVYPYTTLPDSEVEELADRFGKEARDVQRIIAVFLYLKGRLIEKGLAPLEVIVESRDILRQEDLAREREDEIASVFSYSEEEREEFLAVEAFSSGPAFADTQVRPCLLPVASSGTDLVSGYLWTISYLDTEGEQRWITIGLTPGELEQVETTINRAKEQLKAIRRVADSAGTADAEK